jgi:SAM-dependent methyltransferase
MTRRRSEGDYLEPYRDAVERHGPGFEATLWGSQEAQRLRFDVMIDLVDLAGRAVLDVGCGRGDFAVRLLERDIAFAQYVGVDAMDAMVEAARERRLPRCVFEAADVVAEVDRLALHRPDVVCISGALNTMDDATARGLVRRCFAQASVAIVFNFLSDRPAPRWAEKDLHPARRFPTVMWIDWALDLSPRVAFTQAYLDGHDATIAVWKLGLA